MAEKKKILMATLCALLLAFSIAGCDKAGKKEDAGKFAKGPDGLVMSFIPNYPPDSIIVDNRNEPISIVVEVRNKGVYPSNDPLTDPLEDEKVYFGNGAFHLSGFDTSIIGMSSLSKGISGMTL